MNLTIELPFLKKRKKKQDDSQLGRFLGKHMGRRRAGRPVLYLVFHVRNGKPLRAQSPAPKGYQWLSPKEMEECGCRLSNVLALRILQTPSRRTELVVSSRGSKLELTQLVYSAGRDHLAVDLPPSERDLGTARALHVSKGPLQRSYKDSSELWTWDGSMAPAFGPEDYLRELEELIENSPDRPLRRYRWFFFDLDRNTEGMLLEPHLTRQERNEDEVRAMRWHLRMVGRAIEARFMERLREHVDTPSRCSPFSDRASFREHVEAVSDLFLGLMYMHFQTPDGLLDHAALEDAFEMFAGGDLRLQLPDATPEHPRREPVWTTQPSSGSYFWFGEFALLAAECRIRRDDLWDRLANVMVRTQHIYCDVYEPSKRTGTLTLSDYEASNYHADRRFSSRQKQLLRASFQDFGHDDLCRAVADHVATFAPGEFTRVGRPVPPRRSAPSEGLHIYALYPPPRTAVAASTGVTGATRTPGP